MNGLDFRDAAYYDSTKEVRFLYYIQVMNKITGDNLECSSNNKCYFEYRFRNTPVLYNVVPHNVVAGQRVDLIVNPMQFFG